MDDMNQKSELALMNLDKGFYVLVDKFFHYLNGILLLKVID